MDNKKLSIIIVSWNVKDDLVRCLSSISENSPSYSYEVIVVDNASSDRTCEMVKADFPYVRLIENTKNVGFAAANNKGMQISKGRFLLLLNPDTIVHQNSFDILMDFMDKNKNIGACGPKLLYADGTIQNSVRRFPTFRAALHRYSPLKHLAIFRSDYKKWQMKNFKFNVVSNVEQLIGAAIMLRREVYEQVGGLDESFFMYYEEVDWCYRIRQAGWRIVFNPESVITHLGGRSAGQIPADRKVMVIISLIRFFKKHRKKTEVGIFNLIFKLLFLLDNLLAVVFNVLASIFFVITFNKRKYAKSQQKISNSAKILFKYTGKILTERYPLKGIKANHGICNR